MTTFTKIAAVLVTLTFCFANSAQASGGVVSMEDMWAAGLFAN